MKLLNATIATITLTAILVHADVVTNGPLAGVDIDSTLPNWRSMLVKANEDCVEVENFRLPKNAEPFPLVQHDGGTRLFIADQYIIAVRQTTFPLSEVPGPIIGYSYGYELYLGSMERLDKNPGLRPLVSRVWFVSATQMAKIEETNREMLKARIPPLDKYLRLEKIDHPPVKANPVTS
jgi:hypothetical protein